jgi:cobalt/nickel transport protein
MSNPVKVSGSAVEDSRFFDGFTKTMLAVLFFLLLVVFAAGKYMSAHQMKGVGTDDRVNDLASVASHTEHHSFIELPGDAELGAFSIANFFCGVIVGYQWLKLFGPKPQNSTEKSTDS